MNQMLHFATRKAIAPSSKDRRFLLQMMMVFWAMGNLFSQTTWDGSESTDWNNADNWSAGVPEAADDVTIPDVTNDPIISTAWTVAQSVTVQSRAVLTITAAGALNINGAASQGILNQGTVENSGTITIGAIASVGLYGIYNETTFNNNTGGTINIDGSTTSGLYNPTGTFTNQATITIGATASTGVYGLHNYATFNNNTGGVINIDRSTGAGIHNFIGTITNQGHITIGATASVGVYGLYNYGTFNNNTGGAINIDRSTNRGIYNFYGTFTNQAAITIGTIASTGLYGIWNNWAFNNNTGGAINIDRSTDKGIYNLDYFINQAAITIGAIASVGSNGLNNIGTFNNNTGGAINIDRATDAGIYNQAETFTNQGAITIGATISAGDYGIVNSATFQNFPAGTITINNSIYYGLYNTTGTFTNQATITIGATASVGFYGLINYATFNNNTGGIINIERSTDSGLYNLSGTFNNSATITIGATASVGFYGLNNYGTFNNNTGGAINIDRSTDSGIYNYYGTFTNQAAITIGALVPMTDLMTASTGTFSNSTGGTLKGTGNLPAANVTNAGGTLAPGYSPGKMTFTASEDFTNSTMSIEVNGTGVPGTDFDQIVVSGTATLGGVLAISINYSGVNGDQVTILSATAISGIFGSVTGLLANWYVNYTSTAVILTFGALMPVELTDFSARLLDQSVQLNWRTASESNNEGFYIERSTGLYWQNFGFVAGKGTTTEEQSYYFLDEKPQPGTNYYRLKQVDFDGKYEYSNIISVNIESAEIRLFPNPTKGIIEIHGKNIDYGTIRVTDNVGRLIKLQKLSGYKQIDISDMPNGIYFIYILTDSQSTALGIIKE